MTMAALRSNDNMPLIQRLPEVRGRYQENVDLSQQTWFRVGGPAEVVFRPEDAEDLAAFLRGKPADVPVTVIGVTSNLLIRDGGIPGVVVRLGRGFNQISFGADMVTAGAAVLDLNLAKAALAEGRDGLAFMSGIPGSIGGGLRMNAGAYGHEFKDVLFSAELVTGDGILRRVPAGTLGMSYRHTDAPADWIFTAATFLAPAGDKEEIARAMEEIKQARESSQPIRERTGGSTFANPDGGKAWQLIDAAGCRGLRVGGAMVSEQHCNFLINTGTATASDIETLGETVRRRVKDASGVELRWEIRRIGLNRQGESA
ncbi:UDP-N-acetylmuramate dehydrogenase [Nisaea acidiphila]|uniref:UDP-N-acetylenolpyruvoylglucosamine reductase n=2 Tax=Nisaea acidiphila TaxID=1862145 RepID=A0A9J7AR82_9PROT|nr:UDP-N-acetylmuramate dehydrogenase [Nisaea acidiphila]UUX49089.1 UDP-N-acetylmuramate dehydrogenase [Nisaea acidiphila]